MAAKLRLVQNTGGYASVLVKGNEEAGSVTLVLRARDGSLKLARPAISEATPSDERTFEWVDGSIDDAALNAHIARELRFDRDQWFVECECTDAQFADIFDVKSA